MRMHRMLWAAMAGVMPLAGGDCAGLAKLALPGTAITVAEEVSAGAFQPPAGKELAKLPVFCRVAGVIRPSSDSDVRFETWMPLMRWNSKFQGTGNGGFAGSIGYRWLADAVRHGYAAASTDTGHQARGGDASWAAGHPEKVVDFGYRAIHEMTVKGKAITEAFYGTKPKRSYFSSCSNGGRQALMEAQRYPEDYDGIVAGAPANLWTHLMALAASSMQATAGDAAAYIPQAKLPAIQAAALASCDKLDGVEDGVIENPAICRFAPEVLLCRGAVTDKCLTQPQLKALKRLYDGLRNSKGRLLYPGYAMGGEAEWAGWGMWLTGDAPEDSLMFAYGAGFFKYMVFGDPGWDYRKFNVDRDLKAAVSRTAGILNATDPDLRRFKARGGKLILWHGWCDAAVPAQAVIDYYQSIVKKMGSIRAGEFVRLFMVPGMQHCAYSPEFGQHGVAQGDARSNLAAALERWVEQGQAPEVIVASRGGGPGAPTHPLCAYPKVARYKGAGSTDAASSFECVFEGKR